ncbi:uncharacterized protein EDB93DRAFT_1108718 [Suillus bovinus]|uniref:uncharacterized protein n=1 Tax=Suillus bovinus TaxID=48563 RepID=UPI001B8609B9|nr:uncharacterized protein EDB93DRAFT_1108718 [Suillus bovinus]KAG2129247.1 hypothetical protein EDB93DRAFT_1108718 [Suillus bovinus]
MSRVLYGPRVRNDGITQLEFLAANAVMYSVPRHATLVPDLRDSGGCQPPNTNAAGTNQAINAPLHQPLRSCGTVGGIDSPVHDIPVISISTCHLTDEPIPSNPSALWACRLRLEEDGQVRRRLTQDHTYFGHELRGTKGATIHNGRGHVVTWSESSHHELLSHLIPAAYAQEISRLINNKDKKVVRHDTLENYTNIFQIYAIAITNMGTSLWLRFEVLSRVSFKIVLILTELSTINIYRDIGSSSSRNTELVEGRLVFPPRAAIIQASPLKFGSMSSADQNHVGIDNFLNTKKIINDGLCLQSLHQPSDITFPLNHPNCLRWKVAYRSGLLYDCSSFGKLHRLFLDGTLQKNSLHDTSAVILSLVKNATLPHKYAILFDQRAYHQLMPHKLKGSREDIATIADHLNLPKCS